MTDKYAYLDEIGIPDFQPLVTFDDIQNCTMPGQPIFVNRRIGLLALTKDREELFDIAEENGVITLSMLTSTVAAIKALRDEQELLEFARMRLTLALAHLPRALYERVTTLSESLDLQGLEDIVDSYQDCDGSEEQEGQNG